MVVSVCVEIVNVFVCLVFLIVVRESCVCSGVFVVVCVRVVVYVSLWWCKCVHVCMCVCEYPRHIKRMKLWSGCITVALIVLDWLLPNSIAGKPLVQMTSRSNCVMVLIDTNWIGTVLALFYQCYIRAFVLSIITVKCKSHTKLINLPTLP